MLILSRHIGEIIHIGNDIAITVVDVRGNQVRLGIEAPTDVKVLRNELKRRGNDPKDAFA